MLFRSYLGGDATTGFGSLMGPQYQATVDSYAASPQATQSAGNQTLGKSMEQSPVHDGFGTRSSMYDNGMDVSAQPAPVSMPPQPQNQPSSAGNDPSWAQNQTQRKDISVGGVNPAWNEQPQNQKSPQVTAATGQTEQADPYAYKRGGRAKRADGGPLAAFANGPISPLMMTGDTLARMPQAQAPAPAMQAGQMPNVQPPQNIQPEMMRPTNISSVNSDAFPQMSPEDAYLTRLYAQDFNRAPDPEGMAFWKKALTSGQQTPDQIAQMFLGSDEYKNRSRLAQENALMPGIVADQPGTMDPYVAMYNARMQNAQDLYGGIAQQNYAQNTADQGAYEQELAKVQAANQARMAEAQKAKSDREAAEANARQQQALMVALMMMNR